MQFLYTITSGPKQYSIAPTKQPPNPDEDSFEQDTDYHGSDLEDGHYISTASARACQTSCQITDGCEYWSWTPYYHNACWRKNGKGDVRSHYGITSDRNNVRLLKVLKYHLRINLPIQMQSVLLF